MPAILELLQNELSPLLWGWNQSCFPIAFGLGEPDQENVSLIPKHIDSLLGIHRPQKNFWFYARAASVGVELAPRTPQDP